MSLLLFDKTCRQHRIFRISPFLILFSLTIISPVFFACRTAQKTDMRALAPKDASAYLEFKDLSQTLSALTDNQVFQENAGGKPNLSALENIQVGVVIAGFDASQKQIGDENAVLDFKPKFVAVADTHAWNSTAVSIAENKIGNFARRIYGDDVKLETSKKKDANFFVWTSSDGRKIFSAVSDGIIYAGNDESLLEKCLSVKRGETESLIKNEKFVQAFDDKNAENLLVFGYVSPEGIEQFASSFSTALNETKSGEEKNLISLVLPQILQNTTREIVWTVRKTENKIEDSFFVSLNSEAALLFKETLAESLQTSTDTIEFLPAEFFSVTKYNLRNPLVAWRSLILVTVKNTDLVTGRFLAQFSDQLIAPYGVSNAEMFLDAIDSEIFTIQFDAEGENSAVIVGVKDTEKIKKSIAEINFKSPPEKRDGVEIWKSETGEVVAAFIEDKMILGDGESVLKCLQARQSGQNLPSVQNFEEFTQSHATAVSFGKDSDSAEKIIAVLGNVKVKSQKISTDYVTQTRFTEKGIERKTVSDFGFLGTIFGLTKEN